MKTDQSKCRESTHKKKKKMKEKKRRKFWFCAVSVGADKERRKKGGRSSKERVGLEEPSPSPSRPKSMCWHEGERRRGGGFVVLCGVEVQIHPLPPPQREHSKCNKEKNPQGNLHLIDCWNVTG